MTTLSRVGGLLLMAVALCDFGLLSQAFGQVTAEKPLDSKSERQPIDYQPIFRNAWQQQELKPTFYPWEGEKIALLTPTADLDPKTIDVFLKRLDAAWKLCGDITGYSPRLFRQHKGKPTIAVIPKSKLMLNPGDTGIYAMPGASGGEVRTFEGPDGDYERVRKAPEKFPTSYFQIIAQNHYGFSQPCLAFNEGAGLVLQRLCIEHAKLKDEDTKTRQLLDQAADAYAKSTLSIGTSFPHLTNSQPMQLKDSAGQPMPTTIGMLLGSIVLKLREERGGDDWLKKFYRQLATCPASVGLEQQFVQAQLLNFTIAASLASQSEPSKDFQTRWRFPFDAAVWTALKKVDWKKPGLTANDVIDALPSELLLPSIVQLRPSFLTAERRKQNLLVGGTFEDGSGGTWTVGSFRGNAAAAAIESGVAKEGRKAVVIRAPINDDARYLQNVTVKPNTRYLVSGWIKTKDVVVVEPTGRTGANLSIDAHTYELSRSVVGTNDWEYASFVFDSGVRTEVLVCARIGFIYSTAKGEAWFDDICMIPLGPSPVRSGIPAASFPAPAPGPAAKDNLLVNGSFEEGPEFPANFGYLPNVAVGSTAIKGWTVTRGNIDCTSSRHWLPGHGQRSIDLHGTPGFGGVKQTFKTAVGQRYQVSFLMAGTPQRKQPIHKLAVRAADKQQEFSCDSTGKTQFAVGWERKSWEFVARAIETTLEIHTLDTEDGNSGPLLDDVSVIALNAKAPGQPLKAEAVDEPAMAVTEWKGWSKDAPAPAIAPFTAEQAKQHQEAWAKHLKVPVEYTNSIGMKFRLIPPGEFLMGSPAKDLGEVFRLVPAEELQSEGPQHKVTLTKPFYLGAHEVTQQQYQAVTNSNPSYFTRTGGGKAAIGDVETGDLPVDSVSWHGCHAVLHQAQ